MICYMCNEDKDSTEFYKRNARSGKAYSHCKKCHNQYCINRWIERKKKAIDYKGGKCKNCGYDKYYGALDFHHRDPKEKDKDWGKLRKMKWENVLIELDKCDLLCSNCHREEHGKLNILP